MPQTFFRWAGGKSWLSPLICEIAKIADFDNYAEPFLGGGSVFLSLCPKKSKLNDLNSNLIDVYKTIKNSPDLLYEKLSNMPVTEVDYYKIRAEVFDEPIDKAAKFVYLNRTCYGGIHRVNQMGHFNVPYGHKKNLGSSINLENFREISKLLRKSSITCLDFQKMINKIENPTLIYCDPVYTSIREERFDRYNSCPFTMKCHHRLVSTINETVRRSGSIAIVSLPFDDAYLEIYRGGAWISVLRSGRFGLGKAGGKKNRELIWVRGGNAQFKKRLVALSTSRKQPGYTVLGHKSTSLSGFDLARWRNMEVSI